MYPPDVSDLSEPFPALVGSAPTESVPVVSTLREDWLTRMLDRFLRDHFQRAGYKAPNNIRVTCGFPSRSGLGTKKRAIGECWDSLASEDGHFQISVSPVLSDTVKVVGVLIHEVVHATVGLKCGHKGPFGKCAAAVGLVKPWTATGETDELKASIREWIESLGEYPHGALMPTTKRKEVGRMLLLQCECGLKIRTTQKWIDEYGPEWPCPCGSKLIVPITEEDD
jgi:hypothetical protein